MSVFYKFKSSKDFDTINIEGSHIPLGKLKQLIVQQKKLAKSGGDFDLVVTNAQSNEDYVDETFLVPKNTSLLIRRVPLAKGAMKHHANLAGGGHHHHGGKQANAAQAPAALYNQQAVSSSFADLSTQNPQPYLLAPGTNTQVSEEERMQQLMRASTADWMSEQQQHGGIGGHHAAHRGVHNKMMQNRTVPPPNYICHRCNKAGHYIQHCTTNGDPRFNVQRVKRVVGIPRDFLKTVSAPAAGRDKGILMTPDGGFAIMEPNEKAFQKIFAGDRKFMMAGDIEAPPNLECSICNQLLKNAVSMPCCGTTYCDACITEKLIEETNLTCPSCNKPNVGGDSLIPNYTIREEVEEHKKLVAVKRQHEMLEEQQRAAEEAAAAIAAEGNEEVKEGEEGAEAQPTNDEASNLLGELDEALFGEKPIAPAPATTASTIVPVATPIVQNQPPSNVVVPQQLQVASNQASSMTNTTPAKPLPSNFTSTTTTMPQQQQQQQKLPVESKNNQIIPPFSSAPKHSTNHSTTTTTTSKVSSPPVDSKVSSDSRRKRSRSRSKHRSSRSPDNNHHHHSRMSSRKDSGSDSSKDYHRRRSRSSERYHHSRTSARKDSGSDSSRRKRSSRSRSPERRHSGSKDEHRYKEEERSHRSSRKRSRSRSRSPPIDRKKSRHEEKQQPSSSSKYDDKKKHDSKKEEKVESKPAPPLPPKQDKEASKKRPRESETNDSDRAKKKPRTESNHMDMYETSLTSSSFK